MSTVALRPETGFVLLGAGVFAIVGMALIAGVIVATVYRRGRSAGYMADRRSTSLHKMAQALLEPGERERYRTAYRRYAAAREQQDASHRS
jgi:predicted membrane-bound mannosyltransferase